jgi:hypothetical protein
MTVAQGSGFGEDQRSERFRRLMSSTGTWAARILLGLVSMWFLAVAWLGGDPTFLTPSVLLAAAVAASFRWPEVAQLFLALLFGFSLFLFAAVFF